jgi:hypothetical protein
MAASKHAPFDADALAKFNAEYDSSHEDTALQIRGEFIEAYPRGSLGKLTLDDYVTGHHGPSFCNFVESKSKAWANIQGATAFKFGIYFGRTKSDPTRKYRFTSKFGTTSEEAFESVKKVLHDLVRLGEPETPDFKAIDDNPLSPMFKAKILSLYFPEKFLAVCSPEHLKMLGSITGFPDNLPNSQYQHLLLQAKRAHPTTRAWSNPKFMAFLYKVYVRVNRITEISIEKPRTKSHRRIDFEEVQKVRKELGQKAEEFALRWEKERLIGASLEQLIGKIEDQRERPGYGYDFLSHSAVGVCRYIEVKSVGTDDEGQRFFLSDNEYRTSKSADHSGAYYFYLVFFNRNGKPSSLRSFLADQLYANAELAAASYKVRFDLRESTKSH